MNYLILLIIVYIIFDVYYRLKNQRKFNFLLTHIATTFNYYEKLFVNNKTLKIQDVISSRELVKNEINESNFEKLKSIVVSLDNYYLRLLLALTSSDKYSKEMKDKAIDAVYNLDEKTVFEMLKIAEKENIEEFGEDADKWVKDKYGDKFFS